jgi:signal transduction histidine kinase
VTSLLPSAASICTSGVGQSVLDERRVVNHYQGKRGAWSGRIWSLVGMLVFDDAYYTPTWNGVRGYRRRTRRGYVLPTSFRLGGSWRDIARAQIIAASACLLAIIPSIRYLYGAEPLYSFARVSGIAWHTALALLMLGIGVLFARPNAGPVATFLGEGAGGLLARRMVLPAVALPLLFGYLQMLGQRQGFYDTGMGSSLFAMAIVVTMSIALWRAAVGLDRVDRERSEALVREHAARMEAEHAGRLKDQFITALSHELRTPLNAILGWRRCFGTTRSRSISEIVLPKSSRAMESISAAWSKTSSTCPASRAGMWRSTWARSTLVPSHVKCSRCLPRRPRRTR